MKKTTTAGPGAARAFTIVEAAISIIIVSVMLTASLRVAVYTVQTQARAADRERGRLLAQALLEEIMSKPYSDPDGSALFGLEVGEVPGIRTDRDDVDDYDGLSESPPKDSIGKSIQGLSGWTRTAEVEQVEPDDHSQPAGRDSGVKLVTVTVSRGGAKVASALGLRADVP